MQKLWMGKICQMNVYSTCHAYSILFQHTSYLLSLVNEQKKQSSYILLNYQFFICDKPNMSSQSPPLSPPTPHPLTPNFSTTSFIFSGEKQHILPPTTKALLFILPVLIAFTCTKCWNFWHTLGLHIHMVFLLCALVHGFSDCKKLGKPFHILPGHK